MEKLRKIVTQTAATSDSNLHSLPFLHRSLAPLLSAASSLYKLSLFLRRKLYLHGVLHQHRLPVPVISVGNLTWGGNGKTPMTEFLAMVMDGAGIPPLILTRGYAGGDEAKMLHRHLLHTSTRIGMGANRITTAASTLERYGRMDTSLIFEKLSSSHRYESNHENKKVGVVILDDGMQHLSLFRDVEIVMLNSLMPWGNNHLLPRGSLREPASKAQLGIIESTLEKECASASIYFTRLVPSHLFEVKDPHSKLPLSIINNIVVLCVSGIGFPDAFVQSISKIGPLHVDRLDFSDHHVIRADDIGIIRERLEGLQDGFEAKAIVVVTEKDYDRDPITLVEQDDLTILVLCSSIQIIPFKDHTEEDFRMQLSRLLIDKHERHGYVK
ncbi:probable tetraacyldisaccharide 4'-kinase, mitochondrial isoform X2 [Asparagus officinalis]|uniref:probable tetraacyldisaccharide 4'-kinase, mitochondrial isoform X2 n=1 Tax=Asparagus officinalis TaxID=4686 RepID=UPI00098E2E69|nr:probable tetraacyldisaccharide 4'-kinase, mitochondrial isoform X2 [Asparagus officinalis]